MVAIEAGGTHPNGMPSCLYKFLIFQADLPCLIDLLFVGNPLEEKHSTDGDWRELVAGKLKKLKKLDGMYKNQKLNHFVRYQLTDKRRLRILL